MKIHLLLNGRYKCGKQLSDSLKGTLFIEQVTCKVCNGTNTMDAVPKKKKSLKEIIETRGWYGKRIVKKTDNK